MGSELNFRPSLVDWSRPVRKFSSDPIDCRHERRPDGRHGALPVADCGLTEEPGRRIPRRALAGDSPAPIRRERQQHEDRLAERAGEVRDARIDGDDAIERIDERCRLCEIALYIERYRPLRRGNRVELRRALALLQRVPIDPRQRKKLRE